MITSIADVLADYIKKPGNHRLLVIFLEVKSTNEAELNQAFPQESAPKGSWVKHVLARHYEINPPLSFDKIVADADSITTNWSLMVVAPAEHTSAIEAQAYLANMSRQLATGMPHNLMIFDRYEKPHAPLEGSVPNQNH